MDKLTADTRIKFTNFLGDPPFGFGHYSLPYENEPGQWMGPTPKPELCVYGFHSTFIKHFYRWADERMYVVEVSGDQAPRENQHDNKEAHEYVRFLYRVTTWNATTLYSFLLDFIDHAADLLAEVEPFNTAALNVVRVAREQVNYLRHADDGLTDDGLWWDAVSEMDASLDNCGFTTFCLRIKDAITFAFQTHRKYVGEISFVRSNLSDAICCYYMAAQLASRRKGQRKTVLQEARAWVADRLLYYLNGEEA